VREAFLTVLMGMKQVETLPHLGSTTIAIPASPRARNMLREECVPAEPGLRGSFWPSRVQKELLRAGLFDASGAIASWRTVKSMVDLDDLDDESLRLLPLVYANLRRLDVHDPEMGRLKGMYKKTWFENELAFHRLTEALTLFNESGISTTLLKGAALIDLYYRDRGSRSMHDIDVLVPMDRFSEAVDILGHLDWHSTPRSFNGAPRFNYEWEFKHRAGYRVDLHWHVIDYMLKTDRGLTGMEGRPRLLPLEVAGVTTHVLDHPDQLVHVCLHGARAWPEGNVIWAADAMKVLRRAPNLDWDRVIRFSAAHRCTRAMGEALFFLSAKLGASIPRSTVHSLRRARVSGREAMGYALTSEAERGQGLIHRVVRAMGHYVRLTAAWPVADAVRGLPRYLQEIQDLDRPSQVPMASLRRLLRPATSEIDG
jgi:Uncharacterised nucleotidyltransferase